MHLIWFCLACLFSLPFVVVVVARILNVVAWQFGMVWPIPAYVALYSHYLIISRYGVAILIAAFVAVAIAFVKRGKSHLQVYSLIVFVLVLAYFAYYDTWWFLSRQEVIYP